MKLVANWRKGYRFWSVRLMAVAVVLSAVEVGLTLYFSGTASLLAAGVGLVSLGAGAARMIAQPDLSDE